MSLFRFMPILPLAATLAFAQQPVEVEIVGDGANHELSWSTALNFNYQVMASPDLISWADTGIAEPGNGSIIAYGMMTEYDKMFYRIKETADPYGGGFLILPTEYQELDLVDGVCFAFNISALGSVPAQIRIYQREHQSGDRWEQIGNINQFTERKGVKFTRGSVVWIPPEEGEYDVQAVAINGTGTTMASAVRHVIVGGNRPPVITITRTPFTPSSVSRRAYFETTVEDPDNDKITRVEFYDNGKLIGVDRSAPFGDLIVDLQNQTFHFFRGTHNVTAKAYDIRGAVGETTSPSVIQITGGNALPTLQITSPVGTWVVQQGQNFTIDYSFADADGISDVIQITAKNIQNNQQVVDNSAPFTSLTMSTAEWLLGNHTIAVRAVDSTLDESSAGVVNVYVKSNVAQSFAEKLAGNIVDGVSTTASNEVFVGREAAAGNFTGGSGSGLQMNDGIMLSTGLFSSWNGGNLSKQKSYSWNLPGDDRLWDRLTEGMVFEGADYQTKDAAALEFDLFCENGQLEFEFQFGSEEYLEYVENFNDGFLVTVNDTIVSLLPDGEEIVSVNSNHSFVSAAISEKHVDVPAKNEHLYLDNDLDIRPNVTSSNLSHLVEYDGMTVKMRGHVLVNPGQTYHVRIVIGDMRDGGLDSAIFIEKDSIRTILPEP